MVGRPVRFAQRNLILSVLIARLNPSALIRESLGSSYAKRLPASLHKVLTWHKVKALDYNGFDGRVKDFVQTARQVTERLGVGELGSSDDAKAIRFLHPSTGPRLRPSPLRPLNPD